jgi:hypothetical protein
MTGQTFLRLTQKTFLFVIVRGMTGIAIHTFAFYKTLTL